MWQTASAWAVLVRWSGNVRAERRGRERRGDIGVAASAGNAICCRSGRLAGGRSEGVNRGPSRWVGHESAQHRMIELVATTPRPVGADQGRPRQGEIANGIECFVTHEFISETQTFSIEHPVMRYHDRIV